MCLAAFMCHNRPSFRFLFLGFLSGPVRLQVTFKNLNYKLGFCWPSFNYVRERERGPANGVYYCMLDNTVILCDSDDDTDTKTLRDCVSYSFMGWQTSKDPSWASITSFLHNIFKLELKNRWWKCCNMEGSIVFQL